MARCRIKIIIIKKNRNESSSRVRRRPARSLHFNLFRRMLTRENLHFLITDKKRKERKLFFTVFGGLTPGSLFPDGPGPAADPPTSGKPGQGPGSGQTRPAIRLQCNWNYSRVLGRSSGGGATGGGEEHSRPAANVSCLSWSERSRVR